MTREHYETTVRDRHPFGCFSQWPKDVPLPTFEEWEAAEKRHAQANEGRYSDSALDMGWMMATWARAYWWQFFFPDQDSGELTRFHRLVDRVFNVPPVMESDDAGKP